MQHESNKLCLPNIAHFYTPSLLTNSVGTGKILQYGGTTHNTVAALDTAFAATEQTSNKGVVQEPTCHQCLLLLMHSLGHSHQLLYQ